VCDMRHKQNGRAFTLIEVLTIVFIMAILSGAVVPMWSKMRQHVIFMDQTEKLQNFLYNAKRTAVSTSQPVTITWDPTNNELQMSGQQYPPDPDQPVALQDTANNTSSSQDLLTSSLNNPLGVQTSQTITENFDLQKGFSIANFQVDTSSDANQYYSSDSNNQTTFYPDGSAMNTQFYFQSPEGYVAVFVIHAGTGDVDVTEGGGSGT
jgi:Tfp pilus assembly protein FimT